MEGRELLQPGTAIDRYTVLGVLGQGGMAVVYRVQHNQLRSVHALKVMAVAAHSFEERMMREGRAQSSLRHPNVVAVTDVVDVAGSPGLVMEYVSGPPLDRLLAKHRLTPPQAAHLGRQILGGVSAAHRHGLIHRDLKPANILLDPQDDELIPKVADFGLAKLLDPPEGGLHTRSGVAMGTPAYMAPEQIRDASRVDTRADVFAAGAILYEMCTGERPFHGDDALAVFAAIAAGRVVPPRERDPRVTEGMDRVIRDALATDADQRPADATELLTRWVEVSAPLVETGYEPVPRSVWERWVQPAPDPSGPAEDTRVHPEASRPYPSSAPTVGGMDGDTVPAAGARPVATSGATLHATDGGSRAGGLRWALLGVLVVAGLVVGGVLLSRLGEPAASVRVHPVFRQITFEPGAQYHPSLSPDGEQLVYTDGTDLLLRRVDGTDVVVLTGEFEPAATGPRWSPDGERIAFEGGGDLYVVGALGGRPRKVTEGGYRPSWAPDGDQLVFTTHDLRPPFVVTADDGELWTVGVTDGERRRIHGERHALMADWSPTGERIAFVAPQDGWLKLWTVRPDGSALSRVLDQEAWAPRWSEDGRTLYFLASRGDNTAIHEIAVDPATGAGLGAPVVVATVPAGRAVDLAPAGVGHRWAVTASLDSTHLHSLAVDPGTGVALGPLQPLTSGGMRFGSPAFSADGRQLAFASLGQFENLYVAAADGSGMRGLSTGQAYTRGPAFHPSEPSRLAFFGARDGRNGIWTVDADGGNLTRLSGDAVSDPNMPLWSPDGSRMAFNDSLTRAHVVELGRPWDPQLAQDGNSSPDGWFVTSWSLDGRWLAACSMEHGIGRMDPDTGEVEPLGEAGYFAAWMPDSRSLVVGRGDELVVLDSETREARPLVSLAPGRLPGSPSLAVSPDGSTVVVSVDHSDMDIWVADFVPEP